MRVSTAVPIGSIGLLAQGSVHDRKLGPIVVVPSRSAARQVLIDHTGQRPIIFIQKDGTYVRFED
jgi:hypothetical protein